MGAFKKSFLVAILASLGVILSAAYMLWLYRRVIFGNLINSELKNMLDLNKTELLTLWILGFLTIFFGFYPEPLFRTISYSVDNFIEIYNLNLSMSLANN